MNWQRLFFHISFLLALLNGQVTTSQEGSAITSEDLTPYTTTRYEWQCGEETCWQVIDSSGVVIDSGT